MPAEHVITRQSQTVTSDAILALRRALIDAPRDVRLCSQYASALMTAGLDDEAVGAWFSLGSALEAEGRYAEAEVAYREAVTLKHDCLRALIKLGQARLELGRPADARGPFEAAAAIAPDRQEAAIGLAWVSQLLGDIERGWEALAWESSRSQTRRRTLEQPVWDGSTIEGRTILLWSDGGLGDTIQFLRYAQVLAARGARVIAECQPRLVPLVERLPAVARVIVPQMPLPPFDVHAPWMLLPALVGTRRDSVPAAPYLFADQILIEEWRQRLGATRCEGLDATRRELLDATRRVAAPSSASHAAGDTLAPRRTIGIVWGARPIPPRRSIPLHTFARLARVPGVRIINLQQGPALEELAATSSDLRIETFAEETRSIAETAALIINLDLVITVDTMIAHLAGALGAPVWTLLPHAANWRWQIRGDTTAWYPTMRLFRQARAGDWAGVMEDVAAALEGD